MSLFDTIENAFGEKIRPVRSDREQAEARDAERISPPGGNEKDAVERTPEGDVAVKSDAAVDAGKGDLRDERDENRREVRSERNEMRALRKGERRSGR